MFAYMDNQKGSTYHSSSYSFHHPSGEVILSSLKELLNENRIDYENKYLVQKFRKKYKKFFGELISRPSLASLLDYEKNK